MSRYGALAGRLAELGAELDDASLDLLHEAVASGATERPAADKVLTQARRAIDKAVNLLASLDEAPAQDD